jgi:hypothetical protein
LVASYSKGSFPGTLPEAGVRKKICDLLTSTVDQLQQDYDQGVFKEYTSYTTSAGVTLENIEDGILFNLYHEGLHLGTILALLKLAG